MSNPATPAEQAEITSAIRMDSAVLEKRVWPCGCPECVERDTMILAALWKLRGIPRCTLDRSRSRIVIEPAVRAATSEN
jgi:hypothetical protein